MTSPSNISLDWHGDVVALERLIAAVGAGLSSGELSKVILPIITVICAKADAQAILVSQAIMPPAPESDVQIADRLRAVMKQVSSPIAIGDAHESTL